MTQHDEELRETRRRWRNLTDSAEVYDQMAELVAGFDDLFDYWQATYDLAKAYYEQFASDDEASADAEWIDALAESVSDSPHVSAWLVFHPTTGVEWWTVETRGSANIPAQVVYLSPDMTRGQVRRLLTAIGVEVRQ